MRKLLISMLLVFSSGSQATPTTFYRALKHLGFDNKRIAKIARGIMESTEKDKGFSIITKKYNETTDGYRFSQKESGELIMEKFEVRAGIPKIGDKEIIDPNLAYYQLAIGELTGLTGKQAREAELLLRKGQAVEQIISEDGSDQAGIILQTNNGKLFLHHYFTIDGIKEFAERELVDFVTLRQKRDQRLAIEQKNNSLKHLQLLLQSIVDRNNNRKVADVAKDLERLSPAKVNPPVEATKPVAEAKPSKPPVTAIKNIVDQPIDSMLSSLFTDKSLTEKERASLLMKVLDIQKADLQKKFSFLPHRQIHIQVSEYMNGRIPYDAVDKYGFNRKRLLNNISHEKVETLDIDNETAQKLHTVIDEIYSIRIADQQQLLSFLRSSNSSAKDKVIALVELLDVQATDIADKTSSPIKQAYKYRQGQIPLDSLDKNGINRRQQLNQLFHEKANVSDLDHEITKELHAIIDELYQIKKSPTIFDNTFDVDAPQKFFSGRSFSEVATDKQQGKVYLTDSEFANYQTYLYDEVAEVAIESNQEQQAIALINKHAEALDVTICDSGDCSVSLIDDYLETLEKELIERANKNYLDSFQPKKEVANTTKVAVSNLNEKINSVASGKATHDEVIEGIVVTKSFAKKFDKLPTGQQNPIIEIIKDTSGGVQQWRKTNSQESILSYLQKNIQKYQQVQKPRMGEAKNTKLHTVRISRRTTIYFEWGEDGNMVLGNLTVNTDQNVYEEAIAQAVRNLRDQYHNHHK